jgi:hypothetical protein
MARDHAPLPVGQRSRVAGFIANATNLTVGATGLVTLVRT